MKKWFYVLFPAILLSVFLFYYTASKAETEARDKAAKAELAKEKAEADQKKATAEAKAREDAERRSADRAAEEAKAAKEKEDKYNTDMARIKEDTDRSNATAATSAKQVSDLTIELDSLHKQKDTATRAALDQDAPAPTRGQGIAGNLAKGGCAPFTGATRPDRVARCARADPQHAFHQIVTPWAML